LTQSKPRSLSGALNASVVAHDVLTSIEMKTKIERSMARTLLVTALFLAGCAATPEFTAEKTTGLTFIHLNDTYRVGAVEDGKLGGFGRVVTMIREAQAEGREVRVLHGGDLLYPSLESQLWNGLQMVEALNYIDALAPVYFVAGNHEFDRRTPEHLINTGDAATDAMLQSSFTFDHDGKTIGIFSLTSHVDDGGNDRDYVPVDGNYLGVAERVIEDFESQGVDLIIGLTHLYMSTDRQVAKLRENHPTLAFVVGGHDHEPEFSEQTESSAAVMKGASNARAIWRIDVNFDDAGVGHIDVHMLNLGEGVAIDADYEPINQKWRAQLLQLYPFLEAKVGEAALPMDATEETIRSQETSWGNFIVDQMLTAYGEPAADFALSQGYFPQIAGFRVCVDRDRAVGQRIVSLQLPDGDTWQEIDAEKEYTLVVPDFLYGGGDGYELPQDRPVSRPGSELKYLVLDGILRAHADGRAVGVAVDAANARTVELGLAKEHCWN
jgi:5'-nucleotidase